VEITYLRFLDLFSVDDDNSQWVAAEGTNTRLVVADGVAELFSDSVSGYDMVMVSPTVPVAGSPVWQNYVVTARIKGIGEWGLAFGIQAADPLDRYQVRFSPATSEIHIDYVSNGTIIGSLTYVYTWVPVVEDMWYSVRVQYSPEYGGTESRLILYVDGVELINFADNGAPYLSGAVGFIKSATGKCFVDEVEVLGLPAESDLVDINS
jgi:hypothetical protein